MRTLPKVTVAVAAAALVVGAGVALALDDVASPRPIELSAVSDDGSSEAPGAETTQEPTGGSIDEAEARDLAVAQVGEGEVVHLRADRDDGRDEWEVLVRDGQGTLVEVTLDAVDGRVLEVDVEDDDDLPGGTIDATITEDEAREAALEAVGGGEVLRARADLDDGRAEWELDVVDADGQLIEVTIDGTDGRVLEVDVED